MRFSRILIILFASCQAASGIGQDDVMSVAANPQLEEELQLGEEALRAHVLDSLKLLGDSSYRAREEGKAILMRHPLIAMAAIEAGLTTLDSAILAEAVPVLAALATHSDVIISQQARELLGQTARLPTYAGSVASTALQPILEIQENNARQNLVLQGARIHNKRVLLHGVTRDLQEAPVTVLELTKDFNQTSEAIMWLPALRSIGTVYLDEISVDAPLARSLAALSQVRNVKLRRVTISNENLAFLRAMKNLRYLEFAYVQIDDSALDVLATLPVSQHLRLYGTRISPEGAQRLAAQLDSVEVYRGSGGFLGVATNTANAVVSSVVAGTSASRAGIKPGDRLTKVAGVPISTFDDLRTELGKFSVGDDIAIELERPIAINQTATVVVDIVLGEEPRNE